MANLATDAFLFDGQASASSSFSYTESVALRDASQPLGNALLLACHQAFIKEYDTLPADERASAGIDVRAFTNPRSLVDIPHEYRSHSIIATIQFYISQLLRYVANAEPSSLSGEGSAFILGISTGLLAASVVAASNSIPSFLVNAIETLRVAFWLGVRSHISSSWSPEEIVPQVRADITRRGIRCPTYDDLKKQLRSPLDGRIIDLDNTPVSDVLYNTILDLILLNSTELDAVISTIASDSSLDGRVLRVVNVGPGSTNGSRLSSGLNASLLDWSSSAAASAIPRAAFDSAPHREPIAIIGMAVNLPGAKDVDGLWKVLESGLNTVSEIPKERFDVSKYNNPPKDSKRSLKTKFGNFIEDPGAFDNVFFRVSPREARSMDPQQRVLLQVAYHALENSGYVPNSTPCFDPDTFATYVGVATNDYVQNLRNDVDVYYSTGTLPAFLCGKLSYAFGFSGPSQVIDTACSSSIVAIYQACRALADRDCNAAIAGGVNVIASPDMFIGLDRAHFLSATGQCKPWDASADGYSRSEGCGMFVLKRLSDAIAENDNILGIIRGVETNQSAHAESITHPHVPTQIQLFKKLIASSGVHPSRISVLEAHGTGTQAGDPTELESIRAVFSVNRTSENPLHVTSIKANIGHAEAASGAAGLAKLLLLMRKRTITKVISLKELNPRIPPLSIDGTVIDTEQIPWEAPPNGGPRMALLNNFGAAGSNGALILEEAPEAPIANASDAPSRVILGLSCDSETAAKELRDSYIKYLETSVTDQLELSDFAYTATARRRLHRYRLAVAGNSKEELLGNLQNAPIIEMTETAPGRVLFAFSGQGGQYVGMGSGLYKSSSFIRDIVDVCHDKLVAWGYPGVLSVINPSSDASASADDFEVFQAAVYVLEYALAQLWVSWGITPAAVAGHSLGEYAALVTAGVIAHEDALKLVAERARFMKEKCEAGVTGMLAVKMSSPQMKQTLENSNYAGLTIACYNSNADCVVGGPKDPLDVLQADLKKAGTKCLRLNVQHAYHTTAMAPILDDLRELSSQIKLYAPSIPILSNVHGTIVEAGDASVFNSAYFARHCGEPVQFEQGIEKLTALEQFSAVTAWVEIGPHPTTLPMLRSAPGQPPKLLATLRKDVPDWEVLSTTLSTLYHTLVPVDWRKVYAVLAPAARLVDIPAYPFAKTNFWIAFAEDKAQTAPTVVASKSPTRYTLLNSCVSIPDPGSSDPAVFETPIEQLSHLIAGHLVAGYALCPASVYHEMAIAAAHYYLEDSGKLDSESVLDLSEIVYSNPLVYNADVRKTIRVEITPYERDEKHSGKFSISSYLSDKPGEVQPHCSGFFDKRSTSFTASKLSLSKTMVERRKAAIESGSGANAPETFYTHTAYNIIFSRVVLYSHHYHTMQSITIDSNGIDAYAVIKMPADAPTGRFVVHPIFMDTLLHVAGFVINCNAGDNEAFICSQVDRVKAIPSAIKSSATYGVYCNIGFLSDTLAIADAYAIELGNSEGTVVSHMKRMRFRKLRKNGFTSLLSLAAGATAHPPPAPSRRPDTVKSLPAAAELPLPKTRDLQGEIMRVISETCGVDVAEVKMQSRLSDLGIDSLMSIELAGRIQALLPSLEIDSHALADYNHVGDLVLDLTQKSGTSTPASEETLHEESATDDNIASAASAVAFAKVKEIISTILDVSIKDLKDDQDLERLGLDSLTSIEARQALQTALKISLDEDVFMSCKTIKQLNSILFPPQDKPLKTVEEAEKPKSKPSMTFGLEINPAKYQDDPKNGKLPVVLIHDGSGLAHPYSRIAPLGRGLWGIHNPNIPTGEEWGGVLEMAAHYVSLITKTIGTQGCIVGGWSFGGVLAFEVSRQLIAAGIRVPGIVLIDSPHPLTQSPLPDGLIEDVIGGKESTTTLSQLVRKQMKYATRHLVAYDHTKSPARDTLPAKAVMLRSREGFPLKRVDCESARFLAERGDPAAAVKEWETVLGAKVPVLDIPGNHFEPFEPRHIAEVSARLKEALALLD